MSLLYKIAYKLLLAYWKLFSPVTLGVLILLVKDDNIILIEKTYVKGWHLPVGDIKRKETASQAAHRELKEELNCTAANLELLGVYSTFLEYKSDHVLVFFTENFELKENPESPEIKQIKTFSLNSLPDSLTKGTRSILQKYKEHKGKPSLWSSKEL